MMALCAVGRPHCLALIVTVAMFCYVSLPQTNGITTTVEYCVMMGCNNSFIGCYDTNENIYNIVCNCTDGFWGDLCENDMLEEIYNNVSMDTYLNMSTVTNRSQLTLLALADHVNHGYYLLPSSIRFVSKIQKELLIQVKVIMDEETDLNVFKNDILEMSYQIFKLTPELLCSTCTMTEQQAKTAVTLAEDNILEMVKLLLSQIDVDHVTAHTGSIPYTMFSLAYTKAKGPNLPFKYKTKYGSFDLPYWETFHDLIKYETVSVILLTYETSPYLFASNADDISSGLVKTLVTDINGDELVLEDPDDPIALDADAKQAINPVQGWEPLTRILTQESAFLAVAAFNFTVNAVIVDLKLATQKLCTTYGAYGTTIATDTEYDVKVETKGRSRIKSVYPEEFSASYSDQILQLALNYKNDESLSKPFLMTVICEDSSLLGDDVRVHEFRLSLIDLRYFNPRTAKWEKTQNVELASGKASTVAFKSKMFGTFSADMLLIPPDTIDFAAVFLNFSERLQSNPYALAVILSLWFLLIVIAVILRRTDIQDESLWSYLPLVDNNPWSSADYYMTVSTALRSSRNLTSSPYFNIVGSEGETGPRIINDAQRKNFRRGTTSHFHVTTPIHLGKLKHIIVWHDNEGSSPRWLLTKIVIHDISRNNRYVFVCGEWMALDRADGKVWKRLPALDEKNIGSQLLFSELSLRQMFDDNLWFSISARPHFSRFNRVQRLWTIGTLLFLSMIVSAMFYNTPAGKENSIKVGPFTFSYKQLYVGFIAAAMAVIPTFVIMSIFRKRNFRNEYRMDDTSGTEKIKVPWRLPWWSIFFAYALAITAILSSSWFTFLYSLDWGADITLQWLLAFFIGTLQSVVIIEPLKAVVLAAVLAFCCSGGAQKALADVPRTPKTKVIEAYDLPMEKQWCPTNIPSPDEVQEITELDNNGHRMQLDRRLSKKLVSWSLTISYTGLLLILCSHNFIETAYYQNNYLRTTLEPKTKITGVEDIWKWFNDVLIVNVFPKYAYNGRIRASYTQKFFDDEYLYRMGLIRIRQVRSSEKCTPTKVFVGFAKCASDYSTSTEEKREFCRGWQPYNDTCFDENEELDYSFKYFTSEDTEAFPTNGVHAIYGSGGYYIDIGPKQSAAFRSVAEMKTYNWIDEDTRAVFVAFMAYNGNTNLFSYVNVIFELPPFGGVTVTMKTVSANLYPYNTAWDYIILLAQFVFMVVVIIRLILLIKDGVVSKGKILRTLGFYAKVFDIIICIGAIVCYVVRLDGTITAIDKIAKNPRQHVSFEQASTMDSFFMAFVGFACFGAITNLLSPLTFNYHFHLFKVFIDLSRYTLFSLFLIQAVLLTAFTSVVYMFFHMDVWELRNMYSTMLFLYRVGLGMFKVRHSIKFIDYTSVLVFTVFGISVSVVLLNLCISALNEGFANARIAAKRNNKHRFDTELNDFLFWKLNNFWRALTFSSGKKSTVMSKYAAPEEETTDRLQRLHTMKSFENLVFNMARESDSKEQQIFKTCLQKWQRKPPDRSQLRSTCTANTDKTTIKYYDQTSRFTMALVFPMEVSDNDVIVQNIDVIKAKIRHLYPCDHSSVPLSKMFKVKANAKLRKKSSVQVLVVDTKPRSTIELPAFVVSSHDNGKTWETTAASPASRITVKNLPCVSAMIRACPTHLMAISCEMWPDVPDSCMSRLEMHTVSPRGGRIRFRCNNRITITADKHSVDEDIDICVLEQESSPTPMVTITATEDITRPLMLSIPLNMLDRGESAKGLIFLVKEGDLKWQKAPCEAHKEHGAITFVINSLNRRVAKKILVKRSEIEQNLTPGSIPDHYLRTAIRAVCNSKISRRWRYLGKSLGLPVIYLDCIDGNGVPLCSEEKCSFVLHEWYVRNPDVTPEDLDKCIKKHGFPPVNKLATYI